MARTITILIFLFFTVLISHSQEKSTGRAKDSVLMAPYHRNVIKFNPTPMLLFSQIRNVTFSYERLIRDDQSVCVQAGYLTFNGILDDTVAGIIEFTGNSNYPGFSLSFDYRYYPAFRNRRPAPDGLYIGGYASYYGLKYEKSFDILHSSIDMNNEISGTKNVASLGLSLGYQFIFWKRLSLDLMVFGPSVQCIFGNGEIKGDLDPEEIDAIDKELIEKLQDRFPYLDEIFSDDNLTFSGKKTTFGTGFRYSIQVGFHF